MHRNNDRIKQQEQHIIEKTQTLLPKKEKLFPAEKTHTMYH